MSTCVSVELSNAFGATTLYSMIGALGRKRPPPGGVEAAFWQTLGSGPRRGGGRGAPGLFIAVEG